jgi:hypothetical protein
VRCGCETTINDTRDFGIGKRLCNLPALRQVGFHANRRLLDVQRISHEPWTGEDALERITRPIVVDGQRAPALRIDDARVLALLSALVVFRLLPQGFSNACLRAHLAPLLGLELSALTPGRMTYDLTRLYNRFIRPGLAQICGHDPPVPSRLRRVFAAVEAEMERFAQQSHLAA